MKILYIIIISFLSFQLYSQEVYLAVDTSNISISKRVDFIKEYFQSETREKEKEFWHPKYKNIKNYNYSSNIETFTRIYTPKEINNYCDLLIYELDILNDSLSYVKIEATYPDFNPKQFVTYKYYIVEKDGELFLDNSIYYEKHKFVLYKTSNIDFYISPYKKVSKRELESASEVIDSLYNVLVTRNKKKKIQAYVCSNIEEMNIIANMTKYYGRQGGFANPEANFAAYMYENPVHMHEFVHLLLDFHQENNFILEEGIATFFGGLNPQQSYHQGKIKVQECVENSSCNIEDLISNRDDLTLNYSMWGILCEYIINTLGKEILFDLLYDKSIHDKNLISNICDLNKITKEQLIKELRNLILNYDK